MRFIVLDNGLNEIVGHHQHMALNLIADARRHGCETRLLASVELTPVSASALDARPTFTRSFYNPVGRDPFRAFDKAWVYLQDLFQSETRFARGDLLFVPTASAIELYALLHWNLSQDLGLRFAFLFHGTDKPALEEPLHAYLWAASADLLTRVGPGRVWLGATTPALASRLEEKLGHPLRLIPSRTWYGEPVTRGRSLAPRVRVGFLGGLREEKGAHRIPALIQAIHARHPDWQIVAQCEPYSAFTPPIAALAGDPRVEVITDRLSDDALSALLNSLDAVICPYDREPYRLCGSGLLNLAAGWGVPVVVPGDTSLADQMRGPARPLGSVYEGDTDQAVVDAVARVVADRVANAAEAPAAARRWRDTASGSVLVRDLLGWAGVAVEAV